MKKPSLSKLKDKAWKVYSNYIRIMASNPDGYAECVTCDNPKPMPWKKLHAAHFVSGRSARILFAENNVHPGCYVCNILLKGNWPSYYKFMKKEYGQATIDHIISLRDLDKSSPLPSHEVFNLCNKIIQLYGGTKEK